MLVASLDSNERNHSDQILSQVQAAGLILLGQQNSINEEIV
jgi:hypothetical protein